MTRPKPWDIGSLCAIPLSDGSFALAQVVGREPEVLNSVIVAFYGIRVATRDLAHIAGVPDSHSLISVQFTTRDLLTRRIWKPLGHYPVTPNPAFRRYESLRNQGWVGATVVGSGIMVHFLEAYFGNEPARSLSATRYTAGTFVIDSPAGRLAWHSLALI